MIVITAALWMCSAVASPEPSNSPPAPAPAKEANEADSPTLERPQRGPPRERAEPTLTVSTPRSLATQLLVATPQLRDPSFAKSVVFVLGHDEEGAVGLILTHPSRFRGADVGRRMKIRVAGKASVAPVLEGGPVNPDQGYVLHGREDLASDPPVVPGIFVDRPEKVLEQLLKDGEAQARLYVGYCGWAPDQVESEIAHGDWFVVPASARDVFDIPAEDLWQTLQREHAAAQLTKPVKPKKP